MALKEHDERPLVLHVLHHLVVGGMENGLVNLVNSMPDYRHLVACVEDFSSFRDRITRSDVQVLALHRSRIGAQGVRREVWKLCRQHRPSVVHTRNQSGLDALLPARLAGVRGTVHSEHGWDVDNLDGAKWKPALLRKLHSPLVSHYVTVSKDLERFLKQRIGIRADRITQIYNGVDTSRFAPPAAEEGRAPLLPPSFRGEGLVRIGTVGRLRPVKDQATLLEATAAVLRRRPEFRATARVMIVGDGPLLAELRSAADALGLGEVTWLPGSSADVPALLRAMDVFVLPSLNEGISNTVLEAMATGLPVLASAVGGNVELVDDGLTGGLFPAGDVQALATLIERYLEDAELRQREGAAARAKAEGRFSLPAMVRAYQAVYDRVR